MDKCSSDLKTVNSQKRKIPQKWKASYDNPRAKILCEARQTRLLAESKINASTYSNKAFGTWNLDLARTGNRAPIVELARMMKIEATRKSKRSSLPPPDPQLG
jgi:hypothetical protein